jgi:hypothetical protein
MSIPSGSNQVSFSGNQQMLLPDLSPSNMTVSNPELSTVGGRLSDSDQDNSLFQEAPMLPKDQLQFDNDWAAFLDLARFDDQQAFLHGPLAPEPAVPTSDGNSQIDIDANWQIDILNEGNDENRRAEHLATGEDSRETASTEAEKQPSYVCLQDLVSIWKAKLALRN